MAYAAALTLAIGLTFALQAYSLRHLHAYQVDAAVYVSLTALDEAKLRRVDQAAAADCHRVGTA